MGIISWGGDSLWERRMEVERKRQEEAEIAVARQARKKRESVMGGEETGPPPRPRGAGAARSRIPN